MEYKTNYKGMMIDSTSFEDDESCRKFKKVESDELLAVYSSATGTLSLSPTGDTHLRDICFYLENICGRSVVKIEKL